MKSHLCWLAAIGIFVSSGACAQDAFQSLKTFSDVPGIDEQALKKGTVLTRAAGIDGFSRGIYAEFVWWMAAPPSAIAKVVTNGPEAAPGQPKIYRTIRGTPSIDSFSAFKLDGSRAADKTLIKQTTSGDGLFLGGKELAEATDAMAKSTTVETAEAVWRKILLGRCVLFQKAGLRGQPALSHGNEVITALGDIRGMISAFPKVAKRFGKTLADTLYASSGSRGSLWWDLSVVNNVQNPSAGATFVVESPESIRVFDVTFFSGGTYFFAASLYEAWSWNGGALVWRLDVLSIPVRSYSLGMDRKIGSKMMGEEVTEQIKRWQKTLK